MAKEIPPIGMGDIYILAEAPGKYENRMGLPLVGPSGNLLWKEFGKHGITRSMCRIANRFWRQPPSNNIQAVKGTTEWHIYGDQTKQDILNHKPKVLLVLGKEALDLLFEGSVKITEARGYWMEWNGIPVLPTYHPSAIIRRALPSFPFKADIAKFARAFYTKDFKPEIDIPIEMYPNNQEMFEFLCNKIVEDGYWWSLDIETNQKPWKTSIIGISTSKIAVNAPPTPNIIQALKKAVAKYPDRCILHNATFDLTWLYAEFGIEFEEAPQDTMVMHHVLFPDQQKSLEFCCSIYLDVAMWKFLRGTGNQWEYNLLDCINTYLLFQELKAYLVEEDFWNVYLDQKRRELLPAVFMGYLGLRIDEEQRQRLRSKVEAELESLGSMLSNLAGGRNLNSPAQLKDLLYDQWRLPIQTSKGRKPTVDEKAIKKLLVKTDDLLIKSWLENYLNWKHLNSILSKELKVEACPMSGVVHTVYNVAGTESARWSSTAPLWKGGTNLQNRKKPYRSFYVPRFKGWCFISADYSGAEARIVAWRSNDTITKQAFLEGADIHKITASLMFGIPESEVTKDLRNIGKRIRHAASYGVSWRTLKEIMDISAAEAKELLERYHNRFPKTKAVFWAKTKELLLRNGILFDAWGLPHRFTKPLTDDKTFREALAFYPQSTCTHTLNKALLTLWDKYKEDKQVAVNLQIHDELVLCCHPDKAPEVHKAMKEAMEIPIPILNLETNTIDPLVLPTDFQAGWNWGPRTPDNPKGLTDIETFLQEI